MLEKRNIQLVVFLDDFLIVAKDFNECIHGYKMLITLLRELGFSISWKKVCDPTTKLTFLGVCIDTVAGTLSLGQTKVDDLCDQIKLFCARRRASRRQLESLAGKLVWASHVIPWSRLHLRTLFDLISTLKRASHKCKLDSVRNDLQWWLKWLVIGNNTHLIWDTRHVTHVYTDSSNDAGGAFCQGDWVYTNWSADIPPISAHHINIKELAAVYAAAYRWAPLWTNRRVVVRTDSEVVMAIINKGTSTNSVCTTILKEMCFLSLQYNFSLFAVHIAGHENIIADSISRFNTHGFIKTFISAIYHLYVSHACIPPVYTE